MKQENILLTIALLALGGYLVWSNSKKDISAQEPIAESPKEEVPVEVAETQKLSANAAITQPSFATKTFQKDWVLVQNIKTGVATNSHFN